MSSRHATVDTEDTRDCERSKNPDVDGGWAWVVVGAAFINYGIHSGLYYTFSLYYDLLLHEFESSRALTALVGSLFNSVPMLSGPLAALVIEKIGTRSAVMLGGWLTMIGFTASSFATNLPTLYFTYGIITAFGMCLDSMGFILALSTSFHQKYSMGLSMSQAGVGIGLFCFGPLFKWLTIEFGWRGSFLLSGAIGFHFTLLGALIFPLRRTRPSSIDAPDRIVLLELDKKTDVSKTDRLPTPSVKPQCVGLRQELFVHSSTFFWFVASMILYTLLDDFTKSQSFDEYFIATLQAMALGDFFARLLTGPVINYFSINPVKLYGAAQAMCALFILLFMAVVDSVQLVAQAFVYSITYGCQCILYILVPRHIFGNQRLATVFGRTRFFGGAGILIGPPVAGLLLDLTGSYWAVFVFSSVVECIAFVSTSCLFLA